MVPVADSFLRQVRFGRDGAESTTRSYACSIALFLRWCARTGRSWQAGVEQLGLFMTWLAHAGPAALGCRCRRGVVLPGPGAHAGARGAAGSTPCWPRCAGWRCTRSPRERPPGIWCRCSMRSLMTVTFRVRRGPRTGGCRGGCGPGIVRCEVETPVSRAADADIAAVIAACRSARDRLIVLLMARAGLRRGEAAGLRRWDVHLLADSRPLGCETARAHVHVVRREDNPERGVGEVAGGSGWCRWTSSRCRRSTPTSSSGWPSPAAADSDFVLVNLFRAPVGAPMRLDAINELVGGGVPAGRDRPGAAPASAQACVRLERRRCRERHRRDRQPARPRLGVSSQVYVHPDPARLREAVDRVPSPRPAAAVTR